MNSTKTTWGLEIVWADTEWYSSRVLKIDDGEKTPYLYHKKQDITIFVSQGSVQLVVEGRIKMLGPGDTYHISPKIMYQLVALKGDVLLIEAGSKLEDDVVIVKQ